MKIPNLKLVIILLLSANTLSTIVAANPLGKKKKPREAPQVIIASPTTTPVAHVPTPSAPRPTNGSLYSEDAQNASLVSDFKPRRVGDLVFVNVVEASTADVTSGAKRSRDSGTLGGIGTLTGALPVPGAAVAAGVVGALGVRKYDGSGSTQRKSDLQARIVARVVEVLPNGDLRIEAQKTVKINKENEWLNLTGIVRQRDVAADNTVPTTSVGDLFVEMNGKGVASADNAPGWLYRLFEKVTPF